MNEGEPKNEQGIGLVYGEKEERDLEEFASRNPQSKAARAEWAGFVNEVVELAKKYNYQLSLDGSYSTVLDRVIRALKAGKPDVARHALLTDGDKLHQYPEMEKLLDDRLPGKKRYKFEL
ncbi:MAG: hypothetical protein HY225_02630 [Candidatus Vogelbacteria bacterium]|nr:hypothetical protein [Candidatus Vogelbacteria bacterium]